MKNPFSTWACAAVACMLLLGASCATTERTEGGKPWPVLAVKGIVVEKGRDKGCAIINDQIVSVGGSISNVTLVAVTEKGAILQFDGTRRFVKTRGMVGDR
jgi:hypothetical protein